MKLTEVDYDSEIKITDLENMFGITDVDGQYRYNLNETLFVDVDEGSVLEYELTTPAQWPLVSYKIYGTTRLAWLLMKINGTSVKDSFRKMQPGEKIKYISDDNVKAVLKALD